MKAKKTIDTNDIESWIKQSLNICFENNQMAYSFVRDKIKMFNGKLYKYCPILDSNKDTNGDMHEPCQCYIENLNDSKLYLSRISNFNDPFDTNMGFSMETIINDLFLPKLKLSKAKETKIMASLYKNGLTEYKAKNEDLIKSTSDIAYNHIDETVFVACFTTKYRNPLMWAHYANKHKGFCVEYDFDIKTVPEYLVNLFPVIYTNNRPNIPSSIFDYTGEVLKVATSNKSTIDLIVSMLKKSEVWSYEDEWRLILFSQLKDNRVDFDYVSKVILGCNISEEHANRIIEICSKRNIAVSRLSLNKEKYDFDEIAII